MFTVVKSCFQFKPEISVACGQLIFVAERCREVVCDVHFCRHFSDKCTSQHVTPPATEDNMLSECDKLF